MSGNAVDTEVNKERSGNTKAVVLTVLGFVIVVVTMILMRMYVFNGDIFYAIEQGDKDMYYLPAFISDNGAIFCNYYSVRDIYLTGLSCLFKFCGNVGSFIFIYDMLLELAALILIFFAFKRMFGRIAAFVFSILIACYPAFILLGGYIMGSYYVLLWRDERIVYLAGAFVLWILSFIVGGIRKSIRKKKHAADEPLAEEEGDETQETTVEEDKPQDVVKSSNRDNGDDDPFGPEVDVVLSEDGMLIDEIEDKHEAEDDHKVELLISPLPGPVKPKHKDLDYDYEIDEDKMKYDIEIDDTAEFDHE